MTSQRSKLAGLAGASLFLAVGGNAWGADLGPYKPYAPPPPEPDVRYESPAIWQGAYVGINGGYGWSNNLTESEGGFGGGQVGYNWQRERFVFGLEGDFQGSDISGSTDVAAGGGFGTATSDVFWFSTLRGRVGFAHGPFLLYGTGGVAFADISNHIDIAGPPVDIHLHDSGVHTGYAVGGGLEWAFSRNWTAKAEYLYLGFGDDTISGVGSGSNTYSAKVNNDVQTVRLGLNYKF
jgi:outer membrane immunogenic protein